MDDTGGSSETVDSRIDLPDHAIGPIKPTSHEGEQVSADLNANINASVTHSESPLVDTMNDIDAGEAITESTVESTDGQTVETLDNTISPTEIVKTDDEVNYVSEETAGEDQHIVHEEHGISEMDTLEPTNDLRGQSPNNVSENIPGDEGVIENQMVVQEEEIVENIEDADGTPTVVVATEGEEGQYELHMVSSEFRQLTEGLPEGTQLITEDGQLIHAVQEDEHGNVVVLANHPLTEIHTVDEQTGETIITEATGVVQDDVHHVHDVVSEAAAEAQVSFVQEEMLEQPTEMVMLGEDAGYIVTEGESEELIVGEAPTLEVCAETEVGTTVETPGVYPDENMLDKYVPDEGQVVVERIGYQPVQVPAIPQEVHHEEYFDDEDDEIGYQEDVVISESNHTIPNYDEASEIRMLTEAADNSLKTMEQQISPPKKRRSRKKKSDGPEETTKPKRRRRPQNLYFDEFGKPSNFRTESLLKGLENLNLPIATAGTAPMSPPAPKSEAEVLSPAVKKSTIQIPAPVANQPIRPPPSEFPPHMLQSRMLTPQKMPELAIPPLLSPQMMSQMKSPNIPQMVKSPNMGLPQMMSPSLVSPQLVSPRMLSPGQQPTQLSPRTISMTQKKHPLLSTILSVTSPGAPNMRPKVSPPSELVSPQTQMIRVPRNVVPTPGYFPFPPRVKVPDGQQQAPTPAPKPGSLPTVPPPVMPPRQIPMQPPRQQEPAHLVPNHQQNVRTANPHPHPPQYIQRLPTALPGLKPDVMSPSPTSPLNVRLPPQNLPRFQQMISNVAANNIPPNQLATLVRPPLIHPTIQMPTHNAHVNVEKTVSQTTPASLQTEIAIPNQLEKTQVEKDDAKDTDATTSADEGPETRGSTEPKPKIQELIKSELLAAAWESRQPVPPASAPEKKIEVTNSLSATISRVEERLRLAQAQEHNHKPEDSSVPDKIPPPNYPGPPQTVPRPPIPSVETRHPVPAEQVQGSALPPISTLQTKLPVGLVPSTLSTSPTVQTTMHHAQPALNKNPGGLVSAPITGTVLESPPVADEKEVGPVLPGQIPVPRGALKSPVLSTGLGKDPMLSGPTITSTKMPTPQSTADALKSPTHPLMAGRFPAPFPLAFAPGLPPVGLMMQPLPPLGFGRPGFMAPARPPAELFRPGGVPVVSSAGATNPSVSLSTPQMRSPTVDKHKVLSNTLQSPPASQANPLDLIMEVMKKEVGASQQAFHQAQAQKDMVRPGVVPQGNVKNAKDAVVPGIPGRFPTPGPTMEMLMAIMQREVAAAQIQAQVAALHAAHAQAQASQSTASTQKPSVSASGSTTQPPPLTGLQIAQLQAQTRGPVPSQPAVRSALPPVSTVMPTAAVSLPIQNQMNTITTTQPQVQPPTQQQTRPQPTPVTVPQNQLQAQVNAGSAPVQQPPMQMNQHFASKKSANDTLADKYMKEWKPTGRFQCKFCYYSCVTQNFLFRHWVMNHCCMKPYLCAYCGLKSPTRDGITRHQTSKHKGNPRRVVIDATQETTLIQNFKALFNLDVKEIHPEDIRLENLEGIQFPEPFDPRLEKRSPGTANGETEMFSTVTELNHGVKHEQVTPEKRQPMPFPTKTVLQTNSQDVMEQLPAHLREHFLASPAMTSQHQDNSGKIPDYIKRHHKKSMLDSVVPNTVPNSNMATGPLSKEQLHALAVVQAAEIDRSMASVQCGKSSESQKLPSIAEIRKDPRSSPLVGSNHSNANMVPANSTSNTLPSIRDLIQMPRGQILAMAGLGASQNPQTSASSGQTFNQHPTIYTASTLSESAPVQVTTPQTAYNRAPLQMPGNVAPHDGRFVLPAGVVVPKLPQRPVQVSRETENMRSESEAHQAAAQLVSMANSRHMTPPAVNRIVDQDEKVATMVSNVAAAAEQQKAALSIEHEVAAQLEDFARRKSVQPGRSPPAVVTPIHQGNLTGQNQQMPYSKKELTIDEQVALQLEEFRRRKAIIEAQEALKAKKSPKARNKRSNSSQNMFHIERHGSSSVDEVVAQLHQIAQKKADDQQQKLALSSSVPTAANVPVQALAQAKPQQHLLQQQSVAAQSRIDEQRMLATQLEELAQKRAAAIRAAIKAQVSQPIPHEMANVVVDAQKQSSDSSQVAASHSPIPQPKDTMYHLYERAVVESYQSTSASNTSDQFQAVEQEHPEVPRQDVVMAPATETQPSVTIDRQQQNNPMFISTTGGTQSVVKTETTEVIYPSERQVDQNQIPVASTVIRQHSESPMSGDKEIPGLAVPNTLRVAEPRLLASPVHNTDPTIENQHSVESEMVETSQPESGDHNTHCINGNCVQMLTTHTEVHTDVSPSVKYAKPDSQDPQQSRREDLPRENAETRCTDSKQIETDEGSEHIVKVFPQNMDHTPMETEFFENPVSHQETVCHESEMSDLSDRASISPGLMATTPETIQSTPERNAPPNEN